MPRLSRTTELTALSYSLPELKQSVTVHLPGSDLVKQHISKTSSHRILEIPVGSKWSPGAHWHEEHVEHIRIIRGSATVWINGVSKELGPQGEATFEKFAIHDFCRSGQDENEPLLIEEWTETGEYKSQIATNLLEHYLTWRCTNRGRHERRVLPQCFFARK